MSDEQLALALRQRGKPAKYPAEPIARTAHIECAHEHVYRWTMTRAWGSGPTIVWILLNPSTADDKRDDPTTRRMIGFSHRWGFGSMVVGNIYPLVSSTVPPVTMWRRQWDHKAYEANGMPAWGLGIDRGPWAAWRHNQGIISSLLGDPGTKVVAAWGVGPHEDDLEDFLRGVKLAHEDEEFGDIRIDIDWYCIGKTKWGAPVHPLARGLHRVSDDAQLRIWKRAQRPREES